MVILTQRTVPRTKEGYYHFSGGLQAALARSSAYAPYSDMSWLETKRPDLKQAREIARKLREGERLRLGGAPTTLSAAVGEGKDAAGATGAGGRMLVYNLSPSFNWLGEGYSGMSFSFRPSMRKGSLNDCTCRYRP
jgi:isocitrate lyase